MKMKILVLTVSYNIKIDANNQKKHLTRQINYVIVYNIDMVPYHFKKFGTETIVLYLFLIICQMLNGLKWCVSTKNFVKSTSTLLLSLILLYSQISKAETTDAKIFLHKIQFQQNEKRIVLTLPFSQEVGFVTYKLDTPPCLIIDVLGSDIFTKHPQDYHINSNGIENVKVMHFGEATPENPVDLIVVEFRQKDLPYSLNQENKKSLKLTIKNIEGSEISNPGRDRQRSDAKRSITEQLESKDKINEPVSESVSSVVKGEIKPDRTMSNTVSQIVQPIDYKPETEKSVFVVEGTSSGWQLWFENTLIDYKPLQIAQEQVNLAQLRVRKERRNLLPMVKLEGSETKGTTGVGESEYGERRYGLGIEQPVTYGGELRYKLRRSLVNMDIAKQEFNRIRADYLYRVKEIYFKLLQPKLDLVNYSKILEEVREWCGLIRKQYKKELVTKDEYLKIEALLDQIYYQVRSIVEDLEIAKINFKQVLNIDMDTDIEIQPELKLEKLFVDEDQCLKVAKGRRAELKINQLVVDFNQFNREIAKAKEKFKVSLSGFLGRKGSNYVTEPLVMEDEWSVGLKISKPFGTSTATTSLTSQTAPPSLSQAGSNADVNRASFELSLMDKMDLITEKKSAHIEYMKSINELSEIRDTVVTEVKTAYANYKKAVYQIRSAKEQIEKQAQRLAILRSRWKTEQTNLSTVLEAKLNLANQRSSYNDGLVKYYISLSNLAKACGVDSFLDLYQIGAIAKLDSEEKIDFLNENIEFSNVIDERDRVVLQGYIMALGLGKQSEFVIINLGKIDGAKRGMDFTVYREGVSLGNVKVISLRENSSSCLINEKLSDEIRLGDMVKLR